MWQSTTPWWRAGPAATPAAVEKHIRELERLGVKRPATTPIFYRVSAARLTTDAEIEVVGETSGGEVEFVLLQHGGRMWVGTGSDHTDREVETYGVTVSKQMCDKPIAPVFWAFDEVAPHWDKLILRAHVTEGGARVLYQEGPVAAMIDPRDLLARYTQGRPARRQHADVLRHARRQGRRAADRAFRVRARGSGQAAQDRARLCGALRCRSWAEGDQPSLSESRTMPMNKPHLEFHPVDMKHGWATPPGYPSGIKQKILASDLDETRKMGSRTRLLRFDPGVYTTAPFVHDHWEEVYLALRRPHRRQRRAGQGRRSLRGADLCVPPARRLSRAVQIREGLHAVRDPLLRREQEVASIVRMAAL